MDGDFWTLLIPSIFLVAVLYSSVGHGGASGYLAVLALAGIIDFEPKAGKPAPNQAVIKMSRFRFVISRLSVQS